MDCTTWRSILSASLDDEATPTERAAADAHAGACPACTRWLADARSLRLTVAEDVPDLTHRILVANPAPQPLDASVWRVGLAVVALAQLLVALGALLAPDHELHLAFEHGAWELALAVGFATAAWKPARAAGLVPLVAVLAIGLLVTAGTGGSSLADEGTHLVPLVGLALLVAEQRTSPETA